jgi:hypothetical protein
MDLPLRLLRQPRFDPGMLARAVVIHDQMHVELRWNIDSILRRIPGTPDAVVSAAAYGHSSAWSRPEASSDASCRLA